MNSSLNFQHDLFAACVLNVLEKAVFTMADLTESEIDCKVDHPVAVEVSYCGIIEGKIRLVAGMDLCAEMAADMMGLDANEITCEQAADFLAELANMFAGRWITDCIGEMSEVAVTIPRSISGDARNLTSPSPKSRRFIFSMDTGDLVVLWDQD